MQPGALLLGRSRSRRDAVFGPPRPGASGRHPEPPGPGTREAYSHEVSSCGFWPGGGAIDDPAFYSYAYPEPAGFSAAAVEPKAAFYSQDLHEFILPYDAVRRATSPDEAVLLFLQTTYEAAAKLGQWDRNALERSAVERASE